MFVDFAIQPIQFNQRRRASSFMTKFLNFGHVMSYIGQLSLVTRKPVFGVSDQVRLKLACSATETS